MSEGCTWESSKLSAEPRGSSSRSWPDGRLTGSRSYPFFFRPRWWQGRFCWVWVWRSTPVPSANPRLPRRLDLPAHEPFSGDMSMPAFRIRGVLSLSVLLLVAACGGSDTTSPPATPSAISIISGNGQSGFVGQTLTTPLTVKVSSSSGGALKGATVTFAVTSGAASISPSSSDTDSLGQAKTTVTLGATPGNVAITATVAGTALTASFTVTAGSSNTNTACSGSSPQTLALGAVMARASGTGICLSGTSSGAEYA